MILQILRKLLSAVAVLVVLTMVVFVIEYVVPNDPARAQLNARATPAEIAAKRHELGLDRSLPEQYGVFAKDILHGDLGTSPSTGRPVLSDLGDYAPATLELVFAGFLLACVFGLVFGVWAASRWRGSSVVRVLVISGASIPAYFVAVGLIILLSLKAGILPASGRIDPSYEIDGPTGFLLVDSILTGDPTAVWSVIVHLIVPALAISLGPAAAIARALRATLQTVLREDYVRAARARGVSELRVVIGHALRNAIGPVISIAGLQLGGMITGVIVVEQVVNWPGLGQYLVSSLAVLDYPSVMGVVLVVGAGYVLINAAVDVLQLLADPRLRKRGGGASVEAGVPREAGLVRG